MSPEKIPCPVEGCDEVFDDEAAAIEHMKAEHRDQFTAHTGEPGEQITVKVEPEAEDDEAAVLAMVPPEIMKLMDERIATVAKAEIEIALEAFKPQIAEAVTGAIQKVVADAQKAGIPIPGAVNPTTGLPEGGLIPGSPITSEGAALIQLLLKGGGGTQMEDLAKTLTQARAISDVLNPPTMWDRVMQNVVIRSLSKTGLLTESEAKTLAKEVGEIKQEVK